MLCEALVGVPSGKFTVLDLRNILGRTRSDVPVPRLNRVLTNAAKNGRVVSGPPVANGRNQKPTWSLAPTT